jgi:hypothetical protein
MARQDAGNGPSRALDKLVAGMAASFVGWETAIERQSAEGLDLYSLSVTTPAKGRANYLVVLRAWQDGQSLVAFHDAETIYEALKGAADRFINKSLVWKVDQYAK